MTFPVELDPLIAQLLAAHRGWEGAWPAFETDPSSAVDPARLGAALASLSSRLRENYPHFHPLYAGQMLKPPHPAAVLGYLAAMLVNPNNHALDGGRATAAMEKEAVASLAGMFGLAEGGGFLGHLTASGTIANLEALWVARELHPDRPIAFGADAHYTHRRACELLRVRAIELPSGADGRLDLGALATLAAKEPLGTVVVTLGTTGLGAVDPLPEVLALARQHGFRVHVDAAYGGYFRLLTGEEPSCAPFAVTGEADSLVVDPHKHGLQPYGCGCVLFRDGAVARLYRHDSPYTYFSSPEHHPGETTFECSRAGAAAAALWLTLQCVPLDTPPDAEGGMREVVRRCRRAALRLAELLDASAGFRVLLPPALDIVTYFPRLARAREISEASHRVFARAAASTEAPLHLAKLEVSRARFAALCPDVEVDGDETVTVLRSCLMRPEQLAWAPRIVAHLEAALAGPPAG